MVSFFWCLLLLRGCKEMNETACSLNNLFERITSFSLFAGNDEEDGDITVTIKTMIMMMIIMMTIITMVMMTRPLQL